MHAVEMADFLCNRCMVIAANSALGRHWAWCLRSGRETRSKGIRSLVGVGGCGRGM